MVNSVVVSFFRGFYHKELPCVAEHSHCEYDTVMFIPKDSTSKTRHRDIKTHTKGNLTM